MGSGKKNFQCTLYGLTILLAILIIWEWGGRAGAVSSLVLPLPSHILIEGAHQLVSSEFLTNWYRTLVVWMVSLGFGLAIGLLLGFASGASKGVALTLFPLFSYFRSIPPIALFPIALIAIGPGNLSIGVVATFGAALYVFPGTAAAARETADRFSHLAKILGSSRAQFLRLFVAPGAAVHALASSRIAATYSFAVCVAGEMIIGGRFGVGAAILDLSERYRIEQAYSYILCTGIVGLIIDTLFAQISRLRVLGNK